MLKKKVNPITFIKNWAAVIALVGLTVFFSIAMPTTFATASNLVTILRSISITATLACSMTIITAVGGFDMADGQLATVSGFIVMSMIIWYDIPLWLAIPICIVGTMLLNSISMFLIIKCGIPDLLATCAMMFFLEGLGLTYTGGGAISAGMPLPNGSPSKGAIPTALKAIGNSPTIIIIMLVCVAIVHIFLNYTKYGRFMYSVGGNKEAARLSGIPVDKYRFAAGMMSATFIAIAGILVCARNQSAQMAGATSYSMPSMAAVYIGRSVAGQDKPNALGTLIGATLVGILDNGLIMMSVPYYSLNTVKGAVLALALAVAYYQKHKK